MTKNQFKQLAKERGISECSYSGNQKTMFLKGTDTIISAFKAFLKNITLPFKVA